MGNPVSKAKSDAQEQKKDISDLMTTLENKLQAMELEIKATRGAASEKASTEVCGGRTVMRVSEIRVASGSEPAPQLKAAIEDFFKAADSSVSGDDPAAKHTAIAGAQTLVSAGIDALFGVSKGQGMTKRSFVVLFMNNAFVRVDYSVYTYSVSASKWGAVASESGACYVSDLSVLDWTDIKSAEIDFLLSSALKVLPGEFELLMQLKSKLVVVQLLSKLLLDKSLSLEKLPDIFKSLEAAMASVATVYGKIETNTDKTLKLRAANAAANGQPISNGIVEEKEVAHIDAIVSPTVAVVATPARRNVVVNHAPKSPVTGAASAAAAAATPTVAA